jgi:predicted nucleic acid-binding protein
VIVPDINLLVYAYNADAPDHERARTWWEETLSDDPDFSRFPGLRWSNPLA